MLASVRNVRLASDKSGREHNGIAKRSARRQVAFVHPIKAVPAPDSALQDATSTDCKCNVARRQQGMNRCCAVIPAVFFLSFALNESVISQRNRGGRRQTLLVISRVVDQSYRESARANAHGPFAKAQAARV